MNQILSDRLLSFQRYITPRLLSDLGKKMVLLTGPRQVGKTTLSLQLQTRFKGAEYFNYDVLPQRAVLNAQTWSPNSPLLILDEIHKMPQWKGWLKGVYDGRGTANDSIAADGIAQRILVTGSARMDTFRQAGESLAGRFYKLRLHPISVREWCSQTAANPEYALAHLLKRGGFPEPALAPDTAEGEQTAQRWRKDYFQDLIREDVLEFSRIQEVNTMRVFTEMLRTRVGSPLSLASIARDMGVSPITLKKYLDILEALYIVFTVRPWHKNIARATLQQPKVYFFDTGLVQGDEGVRFENLVACHLLRLAHWQQDSTGRNVDLHYIRTLDGAEVDFALSETDGALGGLTHLIECKWSDSKPHRALQRFAAEHPNVEATQVVRSLHTPYQVDGVKIVRAAEWLDELEV